MRGAAALSEKQQNGHAWRGFSPGGWCSSVDVRDFIISNVTPYTGDE